MDENSNRACAFQGNHFVLKEMKTALDGIFENWPSSIIRAKPHESIFFVLKNVKKPLNAM